MRLARKWDMSCRAPGERSGPWMYEAIGLGKATEAGDVHLEMETGVANVAPCTNRGGKERPSSRKREERPGVAGTGEKRARWRRTTR